eukprot:CAMPEP_0177645594 /NCGR_PEP_ID=MMETSP0447-20121125/9332_1 /TAXON_ID=0 /ORGANISM="Stygamoeba regulata, Strain BSH-02190019" /LENGTH=504 /DNA_ID=CAMNT_0019148087 /DNA_START=83 /DNA_END=1597 /DNA_ORIENTATION=+
MASATPATIKRGLFIGVDTFPKEDESNVDYNVRLAREVMEAMTEAPAKGGEGFFSREDELTVGTPEQDAAHHWTKARILEAIKAQFVGLRKTDEGNNRIHKGVVVICLCTHGATILKKTSKKDTKGSSTTGFRKEQDSYLACDYDPADWVVKKDKKNPEDKSKWTMGSTKMASCIHDEDIWDIVKEAHKDVVVILILHTCRTRHGEYTGKDELSERTRLRGLCDNYVAPRCVAFLEAHAEVADKGVRLFVVMPFLGKSATWGTDDRGNVAVKVKVVLNDNTNKTLTYGDFLRQVNYVDDPRQQTLAKASESCKSLKDIRFGDFVPGPASGPSTRDLSPPMGPDDVVEFSVTSPCDSNPIVFKVERKNAQAILDNYFMGPVCLVDQFTVDYGKIISPSLVADGGVYAVQLHFDSKYRLLQDGELIQSGACASAPERSSSKAPLEVRPSSALRGKAFSEDLIKMAKDILGTTSMEDAVKNFRSGMYADAPLALRKFLEGYAAENGL